MVLLLGKFTPFIGKNGSLHGENAIHTVDKYLLSPKGVIGKKL